MWSCQACTVHYTRASRCRILHAAALVQSSRWRPCPCRCARRPKPVAASDVPASVWVYVPVLLLCSLRVTCRFCLPAEFGRHEARGVATSTPPATKQPRVVTTPVTAACRPHGRVILNVGGQPNFRARAPPFEVARHLSPSFLLRKPFQHKFIFSTNYVVGFRSLLARWDVGRRD